MSRIGKQPVKVLSGVKVAIAGDVIKVEGPKGKLSFALAKRIKVQQTGDTLVVGPKKENDPGAGALMGSTRTVLHNMVQGVHTGFKKELDIVGVGYRAAVKGDVLQLNLGYSHEINFKLPQGITAAVEKNTHLTISGADKVIVGEVAAKIRALKEPEPYQGKGVKYTDETIIRKQGKAAGAK